MSEKNKQAKRYLYDSAKKNIPAGAVMNFDDSLMTSMIDHIESCDKLIEFMRIAHEKALDKYLQHNILFLCECGICEADTVLHIDDVEYDVKFTYVKGDPNSGTPDQYKVISVDGSRLCSWTMTLEDAFKVKYGLELQEAMEARLDDMRQAYVEEQAHE